MEPGLDKKKINYFKVFIYSASITFVVFLVILFVIPYTVNNWVINSVGNNDSSLAGSWISFWGSFLGGIVGMFAVLLTTYILIRNQNKHHKEQIDVQINAINITAKLNANLERDKFLVQLKISKNEEAIVLLEETRIYALRYLLSTDKIIEYKEKMAKTREELMYKMANGLNTLREEQFFNELRQTLNITIDKSLEERVIINEKLSLLEAKNNLIQNVEFSDIKKVIEESLEIIHVKVGEVIIKEENLNHFVQDVVNSGFVSRELVDSSISSAKLQVQNNIDEAINEYFNLKHRE